MSDIDNIVTLTADDGTKEKFRFIDLIGYEGTDYIVLLPVEEGSDEVLILEVVHSDEDDAEEYISVADEVVLDAVFAIFREEYRNDFRFVD